MSTRGGQRHLAIRCGRRGKWERDTWIKPSASGHTCAHHLSFSVEHPARHTLPAAHTSSCHSLLPILRNMRIVQVFVVAVVVSCAFASKPPKSKVVKCAVCRSLVSELKTAIHEVDPRKKIDVGSYRIEADGKQKLSAVKYAGSEIHMMETLETVCNSMKDYVQARHKETGQLEAIKLVVDGSMNPRMSEYDLVQDPDLNKGIEFHCESIVEEFEDDITSFFKNKVDSSLSDLQEEFCQDVTSLCTDIKDEL